jgi:hypothetical protein
MVQGIPLMPSRARCPRCVHDYSIDRDRGLLRLTLMGDVTRDGIACIREYLSHDPAFDPNAMELIDMRSATAHALSSDDIRTMAQTDVRTDRARRAFVAPDRATYGVLRMYVALLELGGDAGEACVFDDIAQAERWLGVS